MIKSVAPYIGKYKKYTVIASILTTLGIIANVLPYFFLYQLIVPLTKGELPDFQFVALRVVAIFVCLTLYAILYSRGLAFSHISAYNTLKNIRIALKDKLERQPLGKETHSAKWTAIIALYYTVGALLIACVAYHIGLLIW